MEETTFGRFDKSRLLEIDACPLSVVHVAGDSARNGFSSVSVGKMEILGDVLADLLR